jgi:hypothetical protein
MKLFQRILSNLSFFYYRDAFVFVISFKTKYRCRHHYSGWQNASAVASFTRSGFLLSHLFYGSAKENIDTGSFSKDIYSCITGHRHLLRHLLH